MTEQQREDLKLILIALRAESRGCDEALQHIADVDEFEDAARIATRYRQLIAGLEYQLEE